MRFQPGFRGRYVSPDAPVFIGTSVPATPVTNSLVYPVGTEAGDLAVYLYITSASTTPVVFYPSNYEQVGTYTWSYGSSSWRAAWAYKTLTTDDLSASIDAGVTVSGRRLVVFRPNGVVGSPQGFSNSFTLGKDIDLSSAPSKYIALWGRYYGGAGYTHSKTPDRVVVVPGSFITMGYDLAGPLDSRGVSNITTTAPATVSSPWGSVYFNIS